MQIILINRSYTSYKSFHINTSEESLFHATSFAVSAENLNFLTINISQLLLSLFCLQLFFLQNPKCWCRKLKKSQHWNTLCLKIVPESRKGVKLLFISYCLCSFFNLKKQNKTNKTKNQKTKTLYFWTISENSSYYMAFVQ